MLSAALRAAGLHLRSADPGAMKDFLVAVHARAAEAAAAGLMSSRAEVRRRCFMVHRMVLAARLAKYAIGFLGGLGAAGSASLRRAWALSGCCEQWHLLLWTMPSVSTWCVCCHPGHESSFQGHDSFANEHVVHFPAGDAVAAAGHQEQSAARRRRRRHRAHCWHHQVAQVCRRAGHGAHQPVLGQAAGAQQEGALSSA